MNEFNTKLIELLERIAGSIQCQPDERVIELFKELKEMNEQEIKQEQAIKPFLQSCPLKSLKTHDRELVKEVCEDLTKSILNLKYVNDTREFATYVLSIIKSKQKDFEK